MSNFVAFSRALREEAVLTHVKVEAFEAAISADLLLELANHDQYRLTGDPKWGTFCTRCTLPDAC